MNTLIERCWLTETLAVTVARVDFLDPALAGRPDARERGVRVEIRPVDMSTQGSIYASPHLQLGRAVCRIDLLESAPHAADRMHWHPDMVDGEPEDRSYEPTMPIDPTGWLAERLHDVTTLLGQSGTSGVENHRTAAAAIALLAPEIIEEAADGLAWAREPWPVVDHDERGMAVQHGVATELSQTDG